MSLDAAEATLRDPGSISIEERTKPRPSLCTKLLRDGGAEAPWLLLLAATAREENGLALAARIRCEQHACWACLRPERCSILPGFVVGGACGRRGGAW
jgi:hypothetical protein